MVTHRYAAILSKYSSLLLYCTSTPNVQHLSCHAGSEWDYVILSLVRSLNKDDFEPDPSMHWLREHLGFLTDEHLMNVGLTRARKGLCIIGMREICYVVIYRFIVE